MRYLLHIRQIVALRKPNLSPAVRWVKWSTSLPLVCVCVESLTQVAPNSPITLLHGTPLALLLAPRRPIISALLSPVHFSFPPTLYPHQEKGSISQSLASFPIDRPTAPVAICARPTERCSGAPSSCG